MIQQTRAKRCHTAPNAPRMPRIACTALANRAEAVIPQSSQFCVSVLDNVDKRERERESREQCEKRVETTAPKRCHTVANALCTLRIACARCLCNFCKRYLPFCITLTRKTDRQRDREREIRELAVRSSAQRCHDTATALCAHRAFA
jgi:hypothetical protein